MKVLITFVCISLLFVACGSNPSAPSVSRATLHVAVDASTCYLLGPVAISIDGTLAGHVTPGDAGLSQQVIVGQHVISGIGVTRDGRFQTTWAPETATVPIGGLNWTLPCVANRGYSQTQIKE